MISELFVVIYAIIIIGFVAWNIKKGSFVIEPSKLVIAIIILSIIATIILSRNIDIYVTIRSIAKILAGGIMFAGVLPMISAGIGLFRFGDEYGPNIFYARNHITGVIDTTASLVMIFAGLLIFRLDLVAVGFFFFILIPYVGNALANAYYYSYQRRLKE
ncbi:MAG: monovalent cation/H(+) antiporter subunit G [Candidatus Verstraetearchaeota archaeon]|jgi:multisubunit Na+/H+ antiporter MnhG subunit|nr:monovalent cation/H(+) antiporter subunit G [Candidatus Verstraetearchaeota archaeon]